MTSTDRRERINARLHEQTGETLDAYIRRCRTNGASWRGMAIDLSDKTRVYVSYETLRSWYATNHHEGES